jgi:hypothetical protein
MGKIQAGLVFIASMLFFGVGVICVQVAVNDIQLIAAILAFGFGTLSFASIRGRVE